MPARVRVHTRRTGLASSKSRKTETVILRDDEVVAVLPEGDPLRYLLQLPADRLQSMRQNLAPVLETRPRVKAVLEAIIEHKEGASST